ncbi:hypothetical protein D6833_05070 [Candidatus Parcubacteria bacterium]|nr:MAG: hypothetical protein D6833_05070 [Candidatus Parcubacteria bacterium]
MLYIAEIPHTGKITVWSAFDEDDFIGKVHDAHDQANDGSTLYEETTPTEQLEMAGVTLDEARTNPEDFAWLTDLYDKFGPDTKIRMAWPETEYTTEPRSEFVTCMNWLGHDLRAVRIYTSEDEVLEAIESDCDGAGALLDELAENARLFSDIADLLMGKLVEYPWLIEALDDAGVEIPADRRPVFAIHSDSEGGYWSKADGWVEDISDATFFDMPAPALPDACEDDARWIAFVPWRKK